MLLKQLCNVMICFVAPVCFNTTYCGGELVSDDLMSYGQCCFELFGFSFASSAQCLLCPKSGMSTYINTIVFVGANFKCYNSYIFVYIIIYTYECSLLANDLRLCYQVHYLQDT